LEPITGLEEMRQRRKVDNHYLLTNGPAKLAQALGITKNLTGCTLMERGELYLWDMDHRIPPEQIVTSPRIGISKAKEINWRFYVRDNRYVSKGS
jgi:DNA-3-methyladenine glycosylase